MQFYQKHPKFYVAVDCVIFGYENDELKLLLYPRGFEPVKGSWSLMGGFVQENESCDESALRVLKNTTGLEDIYLEQVKVFSKPEREEFARVISIAYVSLIRIDKYDKQLADEHNAQWWSVTNLPPLIFDHQNIVDNALKELQQEASYNLVGKDLLPDMFTIIQLRQLYDAIYQRTFDPGNFRKKILSLGLLEKLKIKNATDSKKGAFYYRFKPGMNVKEIERIIKL